MRCCAPAAPRRRTRRRREQAAQYGSAGTLLGIEAYHNVRFLDNDVSNHELTHTSSHAFDWGRIAGITRAGHQPTSHAPLMTGGESLVSAVLGPTRRVSINDVMAAPGPRSGPVLSSLSRATIVVSRDGLLPPEEMAYWNFFAARLEDPTGSGVVSYDGQPSFDATTDRRIDLRTLQSLAAHRLRRGPSRCSSVNFRHLRGGLFMRTPARSAAPGS